MPKYQVTLTYEVEALSVDDAREAARRRGALEIDNDVVKVPICGNCGREWSNLITVSWTDENKQHCTEERCSNCVEFK